MKRLSRALTAVASFMIIVMLSVLIWGLAQVDWQLVMDAIIANANSEPTVIIVPIETMPKAIETAVSPTLQQPVAIMPNPVETAVSGQSSTEEREKENE